MSKALSEGSNRQKKRNNLWWLLGGLAAAAKFLPSVLKAGKFGGALLSMLISIGAYALLYPLEFAVGLVLMIFIHELGHVIAAKIKGLPVTAPVFIPFLGALIAMKRHPRDAVTEAFIAIGGPVLGTLGALAAFAMGVAMESPLLVVIANVGFFINLINLLPIHPLDGGRIASAVTRWLWLVGLIGGLAVIIWMRSILFLIIWALFAWELWQKYIRRKGRGRTYRKSAHFEVSAAQFAELGIPLPGEEHQRNLPFLTYSDLEGKQTVELFWDAVGLHGVVELPQQSLVHKVRVIGTEHIPKENPERIIVYVEIEGEFYENDRYYEVPVPVRWGFGAAYFALALLLLWMLYLVHGTGVSVIA